jgi:hypothetical protein
MRLNSWWRTTRLFSWFRSRVFDKWCVLIFAPPGNCKSLEQARLADKLFREYHFTEKVFPQLKKRILYTNQLLLADHLKTETGHGHYVYWETPEEFKWCRRPNCWKAYDTHLNHDVDIFVDEAAGIFPADQYAKTEEWLKVLFREHRHRGIRWLLLTQDFNAVDINIRRMLTDSYYMHKVRGSRDISPSLPPLSKWTVLNFLNPRKRVIWGMYTKRMIDPTVMKSDPMSFLNITLNPKLAENYGKLRLIGRSKLHFITFYKVSLYDTMQDVSEYDKRLAKSLNV